MLPPDTASLAVSGFLLPSLKKTMKTLQKVSLVLLVTLLLAQTYHAHGQIGVVTTLAGQTTGGFADGTGAAAQFIFPRGVCTDGAGNLYVADMNNSRIRKIVIATGVVTTFAGSGANASTDGTGTGANIHSPTYICSDGAGNLYVAEIGSHRIRKIVIATGVVTTLAGSTQGFADGTGAAAQFNNPRGLCSDGAGNLYVADALNERIRKIVIATGVVTTLAGSATAGNVNGIGAAAQFTTPSDVVSDGVGNLYVAGSGNSNIRSIVIATGLVSTLAGGTGGTADGVGAAAQFSSPTALCSDGTGSLYVVDFSSNRIRKVVIATAAVTTIAGSTSGFADGTGVAAQFNQPIGICSDGAGNFFVGDMVNHRVRKIVIANPSAAYTGTTFAEAGANNGTITVTQDVTLTSDTWVPAGLFTGGGTHYTATGVPAGLAIAINRISATVARISFTGTAAAHQNVNDATVTLNFTNAALTSNNAAGVTGLNPASLTLDFNDATAAYTGTTFAEAGANNGTIIATQDVTLTGDNWLPAGLFTGGGTHYTATGVPAGLAIAINRISATVARISFTGTAAAHQNVNDATVTLNFTNAALTGNNAAGVTGLNPASLTLDFNDNPTAAYSGTTFAEAGANNGTITVTQDVTLTSDTWVPAGLFTGGGTHYTATGVPAGLAIAINRISATVARISFTGTAAAHANANDATVTLNFTNAALTSGVAAGVAGLNPASLTLDFNDPGPSAAYTGTTFAEAGANNGTITVTQDVTLTGDTWLPAGLFTGGGTHYTATGVPGGLAIAINRISATVARISFTGTAAAHANANDATVTLNFTNAALTGNNAAAVGGLNPASLTLDFNDATAGYSGTTFAEAGANDGTITVTQDVTLTGDTWLPAGLFTGGGTHYTATGVPAGLAIAINRISATVARISFTGTAAAHANANDATVTLNFTNAALTGNNAAAVGGLNPATLTIDFNDPAVIVNQGITSFSPTSGGAGTTVVITGSGFTGATAVSFGGIPAASFTVNSNTQITAVLGGGATGTGGSQLVTVTAPGGTFSLGGFSIGATSQSGGTTPSGGTTTPSAVISGFSPQQIGFGTPITLSGFGFTGATGLLIGGVAATNFVVVNDNTITAVVGGVPLTDRVLLSGGAGASLDMSGLGLTYLRLPAPSIASISPASLIASGDDASLTLRGFYLMAGARAQVSERVANGTFLQPVSIGVQSLNATQAVVTLSGVLRSPGAKMVTMVNPDGQTASVMLTVITGAAVRLADNGGTPLVFSTTASGRAFSVRLSGTNIFRTVQAFVGNLQARVTVPSSTEAIVEVPASVNESGGTSLTLRLTNTDGQSTTATLRIERRPPPTIMGVTLQTDGRLRVRGVNFLGGIRAALSNSALTVLSQETDVEFVAQIPPSFRLTANTPTVSLTVENPDGRSHGVLLPRSFFEGNATASAGGTTASERTWESGSYGMDMAEIASGKQLNVLQSASQNVSQELRVYPNPIESELRISGVGQRTVRLYDIRGGVVLEERTASGVVNVQALSAGAYMVVVESADGHVLRQRVVKR